MTYYIYYDFLNNGYYAIVKDQDGECVYMTRNYDIKVQAMNDAIEFIHNTKEEI